MWTKKLKCWYLLVYILYFVLIFEMLFISVLIGNKSDLEERQVEEKAARDLADTLGIKYFETSAKSGENVTEAVEALLEQVHFLNCVCFS